MKNDTVAPSPREELIRAEIIARRDQLVAIREALMIQRSDLLVQLRRADRELSDCRATARFFKLDVEFPDDEADRGMVVERERAEIERQMRLRAINQARRNEIAHRHASPPPPPATAPLQISEQAVLPITDISLPPTSGTQAAPPKPRSLREVILDRLRVAGADGSKTSVLREFCEREHGRIIHEKTVGMTLYRLQKDGVVRRDGHIWFLASQNANAENPGADTPGPINKAT